MAEAPMAGVDPAANDATDATDQTAEPAAPAALSITVTRNDDGSFSLSPAGGDAPEEGAAGEQTEGMEAKDMEEACKMLIRFFRSRPLSEDAGAQFNAGFNSEAKGTLMGRS